LVVNITLYGIKVLNSVHLPELCGIHTHTHTHTHTHSIYVHIILHAPYFNIKKAYNLTQQSFKLLAVLQEKEQ